EVAKEIRIGGEEDRQSRIERADERIDGDAQVSQVEEAQAVVAGISIVVVEVDLKFHRLVGGNVAVLVERELAILDEQACRAERAGEVQAFAASGKIHLECGLIGIEEDIRVQRIGQIEPDDKPGACAAFNFQRRIALELEGDAAEGIEIKIDGQGLVEVAVEGQIQAEHVGGGVVRHVHQTTRIVAGQAERFDDAVAQVLDGVGRIGSDAGQDIFERRANVDQVGDAQIEDRYLSSDEGQGLELGVEK